jgi:serine O-acetyltransferase
MQQCHRAHDSTEQRPQQPIDHASISPFSAWRHDLRRYPRLGLFRDPSSWAIAVYRLTHWAWAEAPLPLRRPLSVLLHPLTVLVRLLTNIHLPAGATIGPGLRIHHLGPVVLNRDVVIGRNCTLGHGVTLGNIDDGGPCPLVGDDVTFGVYAQAFGDVRIGSRTKIGAMTLVLHDLPDDCTAAGIPARVLNTKP